MYTYVGFIEHMHPDSGFLMHMHMHDMHTHCFDPSSVLLHTDVTCTLQLIVKWYILVQDMHYATALTSKVN